MRHTAHRRQGWARQRAPRCGVPSWRPDAGCQRTARTAGGRQLARPGRWSNPTTLNKARRRAARRAARRAHVQPVIVLQQQRPLAGVQSGRGARRDEEVRRRLRGGSHRHTARRMSVSRVVGSARAPGRAPAPRPRPPEPCPSSPWLATASRERDEDDGCCDRRGRAAAAAASGGPNGTNCKLSLYLC
jgi:hypothetical protein